MQNIPNFSRGISLYVLKLCLSLYSSVVFSSLLFSSHLFSSLLISSHLFSFLLTSSNLFSLLITSLPLPSYPILSHSILSHSIPPHPILSYPLPYLYSFYLHLYLSLRFYFSFLFHTKKFKKIIGILVKKDICSRLPLFLQHFRQQPFQYHPIQILNIIIKINQATFVGASYFISNISRSKTTDGNAIQCNEAHHHTPYITHGSPWKSQRDQPLVLYLLLKPL